MISEVTTDINSSTDNYFGRREEVIRMKDGSRKMSLIPLAMNSNLVFHIFPPLNLKIDVLTTH